MASTRTRDEIKAALQKAFRAQFPHDTVDVSDGYNGNIHVLVVSRRFDKLSEPEKQDLMWGVIDASELDKEEKLLISLVMPVSPTEIK